MKQGGNMRNKNKILRKGFCFDVYVILNQKICMVVRSEN